MGSGRPTNRKRTDPTKTITSCDDLFNKFQFQAKEGWEEGGGGTTPKRKPPETKQKQIRNDAEMKPKRPGMMPK